MTLGILLLIILIVMLIGAMPRWSFNKGWGYGESCLLGIVLVVVLVLLLTGQL